MSNLDHLLAKNAEWAKQIEAEQPGFFSELAKQQSPEYLWIGCSDSRVPVNQLVGAMPGEVFVHRNIANSVIHTDINCLSVIQYAVEALKVKHIVVCGHYGCGGVAASIKNVQLGLIDNWLRHITDTFCQHQDELETIGDEEQQVNRLVELNVAKQVNNVARTTIVQDAWNRGQPLTIHGLVYGLKDGLLKDLDISINSATDIPKVYQVETWSKPLQQG